MAIAAESAAAKQNEGMAAVPGESVMDTTVLPARRQPCYRDDRQPTSSEQAADEAQRKGILTVDTISNSAHTLSSLTATRP